ncbi:alpha-galactosidase [Lacisediminihabitans sp.]|uniref:alpha-galactosidase n=1 Tax=Lacisediminihabitans sp. TaxID=2787631 RepID=UPI002F9337EB
MLDTFSWGNEAFALSFEVDDASKVHLAGVTTAAGTDLAIAPELPLVEVLAANGGHAMASDRLAHTAVGERLEFRDWTSLQTSFGSRLEIRLVDPVLSLAATYVLEADTASAAWRSHVELTNESDSVIVLRAVPSWSAYLGGSPAGARGPRNWSLTEGSSDWLAEGRWTTTRLSETEFPDLAAHLTNHNPRGELSRVSTGTWSTGKQIPIGALSSGDATWVWQIEHNGPWRWEIAEDLTDGYFALSGPTDCDHQWSKPLAPGASFHSVPASVALGNDLTSGIAQLTAFRRASRREHNDNVGMKVVFNDYMNTLNGDPTTAKLLPLIDAAADAGAEVFCIDAGWYDDGGDWWDSVGEWKPSTTRFPGGLHEVVERIIERGMTPGLWLEPEVVGLRSPVAASFPDSAFLMRNGQRLVEHGRFHLDFRSAEVIAHLDEVVDRLVNEFRVGFFKLDYNINPGPGTDYQSDSVGDGLLEHNRAHLGWIDSVLDRHPTLILENCGSGAMRMDFAMLSRMQLQSTSDQQDFLKYPPIAAAAPMSMLPEQAASWAYPQPTMSREEAAFCLATGLLGRFYLSGYLNEMSPEQREMVATAVAVAKELRGDIRKSVPFWPLGLPTWTAPSVALGLRTPSTRFLTVWDRGPTDGPVCLELPDLIGAQLRIDTIFPRELEPWTTLWDSATGTLSVHNPTDSVGARTFQLTPVGSES